MNHEFMKLFFWRHDPPGNFRLLTRTVLRGFVEGSFEDVGFRYG